MPSFDEPMREIHTSISFPLHDEVPRPRRSVEPQGLGIGRFVAGLIRAKRRGLSAEHAGEWVTSRWTDKRAGDAVTKALNSTGTSTGGALVPQDFAREFIELLRAETVVRRAGPLIVDMPAGNKTFPRLAAAAVAGFSGELDEIITSQQSLDALQLNAKKMTALVPVSNDLLRRSPVDLDAILRDDLIQAVARREDVAFLLGDGSLGSPIGFLNQVPASQKVVVNPPPASDDLSLLTNASGVLFSLVAMLKQNMSRMIRPTWISAPGTFEFLGSLSNGNGQYVFRDELDRGRMLGIPYFASQQIPSNLLVQTVEGQAPSGAYLFLADFADVVIGETLHLEIDVSDSATYTDVTGSAVNAFVRDQMLYRCVSEIDFGLRHAASLVVATLPGWVPPGFSAGNAGAPFFVQAPSGDGSAAAATWGIPPTGSNNPGNNAANAPGAQQPGRP